MLVDTDQETKRPVLLCDYGAATFYEKKEGDMEPIEVRAWGILAHELLTLRNIENGDETAENRNRLPILETLASRCQDESPRRRPTFSELVQSLSDTCAASPIQDNTNDPVHGL